LYRQISTSGIYRHSAPFRKTLHSWQHSRSPTASNRIKSAALGAAALQVWARAVEAAKTLDRKTVAEAIRGKTIKGTVFGDATFLPNGQLQPRYVVFKVIDGKTAKLEPLPQN